MASLASDDAFLAKYAGEAAPAESHSSSANDDAALWGGPDLASLDEILAAQKALRDYPDVLRTPLVRLTEPFAIRGGGGAGEEPAPPTILLKLESLQTTGSFKLRGFRYKFRRSDKAKLKKCGVVTMSAGNAGKACAYLGQKEGVDVKIFMPASAPDDRKAMLESFGATVVKTPGARLLEKVAAAIADEGRVFVHPFDDVDIVRGHASCGLEILEDAPAVDLVAVCCGGGGLLSGVAAAVKQACPAAGQCLVTVASGFGGFASMGGGSAFASQKASYNPPPPRETRRFQQAGPPPDDYKVDGLPRVVGVEPEGACSMVLSVAAGEAAWCPDGGATHTVAHGLAPPFAGRACYNHVRKFVDDVVAVTDDDMRAATQLLFRAGIVAEVSGAAALAAVLAGKCGSARELAGKTVVCTVSGRNIGFDEFEAAIADLSKPMAH